MAFEVAERDQEIVIGHMVAHDIVFQMGTVAYRNAHLAFLVHDIHGEAGRKAVTGNHFPMVGRGVAIVIQIVGTAAVGGIALHDGAVHAVDQRADEFRLEVVWIAALSGRHLHRHAAGCRHAKRLIDPHQRFGGYFPGQVDGCAVLVAAAAEKGRTCQ